MTDPRIAKLRAKAADKAVTPEERDALNRKADELEAKDLSPKLPTIDELLRNTQATRDWQDAFFKQQGKPGWWEWDTDIVEDSFIGNNVDYERLFSEE